MDWDRVGFPSGVLSLDARIALGGDRSKEAIQHQSGLWIDRQADVDARNRMARHPHAPSSDSRRRTDALASQAARRFGLESARRDLAGRAPVLVMLDNLHPVIFMHKFLWRATAETT